ncbi:MAG: hypothetical protein QOE18_463, partial [Chloroflexota bacterium]|nr:hypothetical protein [Chloroflexota bacterium]
ADDAPAADTAHAGDADSGNGSAGAAKE